MDDVIRIATIAGNDFLKFLNWLGIHPSPQDLVKAVLLILFVLAILMVVGDVYRGEIQNKVHRIVLAPTTRGQPLSEDIRREIELRRRMRKEKDILCHVPQSLVPMTQN